MVAPKRVSLKTVPNPGETRRRVDRFKIVLVVVGLSGPSGTIQLADDFKSPIHGYHFGCLILDPSLLFLTSRARSFTLIFSSVRHQSPEQFGAKEIDWRTERFQEIRHANRRDCVAA
jgi:hypothetical protein